MTNFPVRPRALFGVATLLAMAGCSPESLAPRAPLASRQAGETHFNSQKYRDSGRQPVVGRSGAAAIQAEALIGSAGQVTVAVTSYRAGDLTAPAGIIDKVQVKAFDAAGRLLATRIFSGPTPFSDVGVALAGLAGAATFQVQATVRGIDGRRTDIVTVGGIVPALAPDLAVSHVVAPGTAIAGAPTVIGATVIELGGAHGARGNCVLYVNGTAVDRSSNIWVDAGDVVSCAFTRIFATAGSYSLRVAVEQVLPADGDPSNNSATATLAVAAPAIGGADVSFNGDVRNGTFVASDTFETTWLAPDGSLVMDIRNGSASAGSEQSVMLSGLIGTTLTFPLTRFEMSQNADGLLVQSLRADNVAPTYIGVGVVCTIIPGGHGGFFFLCVYPGYSTLTYQRSAGVVTYQSSAYSKIWNGASYDQDSYVVNDVVATGVVDAMTSQFAINIQITDGSTLYAMNAVVPLGPLVETRPDPRHCDTVPIVIAPTTYTTTTCASSSYAFTGVAGSLSGAGFTAQTLTP